MGQECLAFRGANFQRQRPCPASFRPAYSGNCLCPWQCGACVCAEIDVELRTSLAREWLAGSFFLPEPSAIESSTVSAVVPGWLGTKASRLVVVRSRRGCAGIQFAFSPLRSAFVTAFHLRSSTLLRSRRRLRHQPRMSSFALRAMLPLPSLQCYPELAPGEPIRAEHSSARDLLRPVY